MSAQIERIARTPQRGGSAAPHANPFPGLRPFEFWEHHLFFGRENQIDSLLWKLTRNRFVSIVGTSGSGKSSLVRAGLLPVLMGGAMAQAGSSWRVAVLRPGDAPLGALAHALHTERIVSAAERIDEEHDPTAIAASEGILRDSPLGLVQAARAVRDREENLLIVVDQFEEIFRVSGRDGDGSAEADAFVRLLLEAVQQVEIPIYVIITLRSDFLGECARFRDLPETINEGQYLIPRLQPMQVRAAITGPIAVGGGKIAPRLVQQLLNDVGTDPDQLPILQHALMRTWEKWGEVREGGEPIDLLHYDAIGTMRSALSQHADEAYAELPDERSRAICQLLFTAITEIGPDNRGVRRPTSVAEICAMAGAGIDEVRPVVDTFRRPGRSFIHPPSSTPLTPETVLDISHESLMRVWDRLRRWVEEQAESVQTYRRVVESALLYSSGQAGLLHDPELALAEAWRSEERPSEAWGLRYHPAYAAAMRFLDRSIAHRRQTERDRRRRRRLAQGVGVAFLICSMVLTLWAMNERAHAEENYRHVILERQESEQQREEAERQRGMAQRKSREAEQSRKIAEEQRATAEDQRRLAEERRTDAERQKEIAQQQRSAAEKERRRAEEQREEAERQRGIAEQQRLTALDQQRRAEEERRRAESLSDSISRAHRRTVAEGVAKSVQLDLVGDDEVNALLALNASALSLANGGDSINAQIYSALFDVAKRLLPEERRVVRAHGAGVRSIVATPDGAHLLSAGSDGKLISWRTGTIPMEPTLLVAHPHTLRAAAVSPRGDRAAYVGEDEIIRIIPFDAPLAAVELRGSASAYVDVAFLDDDRLAALGSDGVIELWDHRRGIRTDTHGDVPRLRVMAVGAMGEMIAGATSTGEILVWSDADGPTPRAYTTSGRPLLSLALSADGERIAAGLGDGTILVWKRGEVTPRSLNGHRAGVVALAFAPDGTTLASGGNDAAARLWDLSRPEAEPIVLHEHTSWIWSIAFDPTGTLLYSAGADQTIRMQPTDADDLARTLHDLMRRDLTQEEWAEHIGTEIPYERIVDP